MASLESGEITDTHEREGSFHHRGKGRSRVLYHPVVPRDRRNRCRRVPKHFPARLSRTQFHCAGRRSHQSGRSERRGSVRNHAVRQTPCAGPLVRWFCRWAKRRRNRRRNLGTNARSKRDIGVLRAARGGARLRPQTERSKRVNPRLVSAAIVLVLSGILLGAGVYESVVLAPNLQGAPTSLEHARGFYHLTNPRSVFQSGIARDTTFPRGCVWSATGSPRPRDSVWLPLSRLRF